MADTGPESEELPDEAVLELTGHLAIIIATLCARFGGKLTLTWAELMAVRRAHAGAGTLALSLNSDGYTVISLPGKTPGEAHPDLEGTEISTPFDRLSAQMSKGIQ